MHIARAVLLLTLCPLFATPLLATGQSSTDPDFRFGAASGSFGVRGGAFLARADGDVYTFVSDLLTVEKSSFNAPTFGFDVAKRLHPRVDVLFGLQLTRASVDSEYRDFVDNEDLPIEQQTRLTNVPLTASLKLFVTPRGRAVSSFAYVPNKVAGYVGAGFGTAWYRFEQMGDFIDFQDFSVFNAQFVSSGWGLATHVFGGADIRVGNSLFLSAEARYTWADAGVGDDFEGFEPIDLSGLSITLGVNVEF